MDALAASDARATFFVVAPLARRHPDLLRQAVDEGHEVALYCNSHTRHDRMGAEEVLSDASEGLRTLRDLGHRTPDWRVPWGVVTAGTQTTAETLGMRLVGWTAWTGAAVMPA